MSKEIIKGVMPNSLNECVVHKNVPKTQKSFRITSALLKNLCNKAQKINKQARLNIVIPDGDTVYQVSAIVTRSKEAK